MAASHNSVSKSNEGRMTVSLPFIDPPIVETTSLKERASPHTPFVKIRETRYKVELVHLNWKRLQESILLIFAS